MGGVRVHERTKTLGGVGVTAAWPRTVSGEASRGLARRTCVLLFAAALFVGCAPRPSTFTAIEPPRLPGEQAGDPAIAVDPATHDVQLAWLAGDSADARLWTSRSTDGGSHWSPPLAVSAPGERFASGESSPRIACDGSGRVALLWSTIEHASEPGRRGGALRFARSLDRGLSWSAPVTLHDDRSGPVTRAHQEITSTDHGRLLVAWVERSSPDAPGSHHGADSVTTVHVTTSNDFGGQWSSETLQWTRACPCCRIGLGIDLNGGMFAAFRRHYDDGACDVALARPGGPSVRSFHDGWGTETCPDAGPGFTMARDGSMRLAWYTGEPQRVGLWFRQNLPETYDSTLTPIRLMASETLPVLHASVADAGRSGTLIACDGDSTGAGVLSFFRVEASGKRVVERQRAEGVRDAVRPQVAASNRSRRAYVAWTEQRDGSRRLRLLRWDVGR